MLKRYKDFINEGINDYGMSYDDIREIAYYITDEFPNLTFSIEDSSQSSIIEKDDKSFIIEFYDSGINFPSDLPVLHYVEPKIHNLISDIDSQLKKYGLEVFYSDFGQNDAYYELVITEISHKPEFNSHRYTEDPK